MTPPRARAAAGREDHTRVLLEPLEPRYLLSADLMPFNVAMGADGDDFTLRLHAETDYLQVLDNRSDGAVIAEQARGETSEVRITGSDLDDRLRIDLAVQFALATGIHFDAGPGSDALEIMEGVFDAVQHGLGIFGDGAIEQLTATDDNTVAYTGVEALTDTSAAAERIIANETGEGQTLRLDDAGTADDGLITVDDNDSSGFTALTLAAPGESLVLQAGDEGDTIALAGIDTDSTAVVSVRGGSGEDTLAGPDADSDWTIDGAGAGTLSGTVDAQFTDIENLEGGAGDDTFTLTESGSLDGAVDGGAGDDTLAGADTDNTWEITGDDAGTLNALAFRNIENLQGGAGDDTFRFLGGRISGTVDGGTGNNTFDYSAATDGVILDLGTATATSAGRVANVTGFVGGAGADTLVGPDVATAFAVTGVNSGTAAGVHYRDVENLRGGAGDDSFAFGLLGDLAGWIDGGLGLDTLFGSDADNSFHVMGENAGALDGRAFLDIENLEGGAGDDTFLFAAGGMLAGAFAGGLGHDRVRGADQRNSWRVLGGGSGTFNDQGFSGMEEILGGADEDTLHGPANDSTWTVSGVNAGDVAGVSFSGMENLAGAADNEDTFHLLSGGQATGGLEGGAAGFDSIVVDADGEATEFEATGPDSGSITIGDRTTAYSGFEPVDAFDSTDITIILGDGDDTGLTLTLDESESDADTDVFNLDGPGIETHVLHIDDATNSVTIDLGDGENDIEISGVSGTRLSGILDVNGGAGNDTFTLGEDYGDLGLDAGSGGTEDSVIVEAGGITTVTGSQIENDADGDLGTTDDVSTATISGDFESITGDSIVLDVAALLNAADRAFAEITGIFAAIEQTGDFAASLPLISGSNLGDVVDVTLGRMGALEEMLGDIRFGVLEAINGFIDDGTATIGDLRADLDAVDKTVGHLGPGVISTALDVEENLQSALATADLAGLTDSTGFSFTLTLTPEDGPDITQTISTTFDELTGIAESDPPSVEDLAAALNVAIGVTDLGGQVAAVARDGRIGFQVLSPEAEALSVQSALLGGQNLADSVLGYPAALSDALSVGDVKDRLTALGANQFSLDNIDFGLVDDSTYLFSLSVEATRTSDFGFDFGADADEQGLEFDAAARLEAVLGAFFAADLILDLGDLGNTGDDSFDADITELGAGFEVDATVNAGAKFGFLSTEATGDVDMDAGLEADTSTPLSFSSGNDAGVFASGISFSVVGFDSASTALTGDDDATVTLDFEADAGLVSGTLTLDISITDVFSTPDPTITYSGDADVADFADFNNLTASGVIRSLADLSSWLQNLTESELIANVDIPVLEGGIGAVADVASLISNALLFDVGGDGAQDRDDKLATDLNNGLAAAGLDRFLRAVGTGAAVELRVIDDNVTDVEIADHTLDQLDAAGGTINFSDVLEITGTAFLGGVLANDLRGTFRVTVNSGTVERQFNVSKDVLADNIGFGDDTPRLLDAFNSPNFSSATELADVLDDIGVLPDGPAPGDGLDYDETEDRLTYAISIADRPVFATELGTDFEIDLSPVLDIESSSRLVLTGEGTIQLVLGWDLSSDGDLPGTAAELDTTTLLADLGIVAGEKLKTDKAVTAGDEPNAIRGVLTNDASFTLSVTEDGGGETSAVVTVAEADTLDNTTTADLVSDIVAAIGDTALDGLVTVEADGDRLRFVEDGGTDLEEIAITVASGDPAQQAFGLEPSQSAQSGGGGATLTARNEVPALVGVLTDDATFEIEIDGTTYEITVTAESTFSTDGDAVTGINRNIIDLATDVRNALREARPGADPENPVDITDRVEVGTQGSRLVLTLVDDSATDMTVTPLDAGELGLTSTSEADTVDLIVKLIDGSDDITEVRIDLSNATDIQDVIDAFDDANSEAPLSGFGGANLELGIVADDPATPEDESGKQLFVSYDDGSRRLFAIEATNGSGVAAALGIVGMDENPFDPDSVADGVIEGAPIGGVTLADRFFLSAPDGGDLSGIASFGFDAQAARLVTDIQVIESDDSSVTGIVGSVDFRNFVGETIAFRNVNGFDADTFTIDDVVEIDTDGEDGADTFVAVLAGSGSLPAVGSGGGVALIETGIDATASLGFIDVTLTGEAAFGADLSLGLDTGTGAPAADGILTLAELLEVFDRDSATELLDVVAPPKITFDDPSDAFGGIDLTLGIADPDGTFGIASDLLTGITPDLALSLLALGDPFLKTKLEQAGGLTATDADSFEVNGDFTDALAEGAKLRITPDGGDPVNVEIDSISHSGGTTTVDLTGVDGSSVPDLQNAENLADADIVLLPTVDADLPDFGALGDPNFAEFGMQAILAALGELVDLLGELEGFDLLDQPIPLVDRSVADIIAIGEDVAGFIDAFGSDPAGSLQSVEAAINDAIGLSADTLSDINDVMGDPLGGVVPGRPFELGYNAGEEMLTFEFTLGAFLAEQLPVGFDLGDALGDALGNLANLSGSAGLEAAGGVILQLGLGFDFGDFIGDPGNVPDALYVLEDSTGLEAALSLSAEDLAFTAGLGPMALIIQNTESEVARVALDLGMAIETRTSGFSSGRAQIADVIADLGAHFELTDGSGGSSFGTAEGTLPVFFPNEGNHAGTIHIGEAVDTGFGNLANIETPNVVISADELSGATDSQFVIDVSEIVGFLEDFDPAELDLFSNILLAVDSLDQFLGFLQDEIFGTLTTLDLPIVGESFADAATFIGDFRDDFVGPLRAEIDRIKDAADDFADPDKNVISQLLFDLLGPDGLNLLEELSDKPDDLTPGDSPEDFIKLDSELLQQFLDGDVGLEEALIAWDFTLGQDLAPLDDINIGFDLGIPGLGLETDGSLDIDLGWNLDLGFGISGADGFFFNIDPEENELSFDFDVTVASGSSITGKLGFLALRGENAERDLDGDEDNETTGLNASFGVDLFKDGDPDAETIGFTELGSLRAGFGVFAEAAIVLDLMLGLNSDIVGDTVATGLPSVEAGFNFLWQFGDAGSPITDPGLFGDALADSLKHVSFSDVGVNLGEFVSEVLKPVVDKVAEVTEPLQPIIDFLTAPVPIISEFGVNLTMLDLAAAFGEVDPRMIESIADVITLINTIAGLPGDDLIIPLVGDGDLTSIDGEDLFLLFDASGGSGLNPFGNDLTSDTNRNTLNSQNNTGSLDLLGNFGSDSSSQDVKRIVEGGGATFDFPFITDPGQIFNLLLGQPMDLVTVDLQPLQVGFEYSQFFSIFGPLGVSINLVVEAVADFAFGMDTLGVQQFVESDFQNPLLILNGLFVSDRENPNGTGADVPELSFLGGAFAAAELNLGVARGGVAGGLFIEILFDLFDPDDDGKVRISELVSNFENQLLAPDAEKALAPLAIFDVTGEIFARLFAFLKIDFGLVSINKEFDIVDPITILDFEIDFFRPPTVASEQDNGDLTINIGPFAEQRLLGDTRDFGETVFIEKKSVSGDTMTVDIWTDENGFGPDSPTASNPFEFEIELGRRLAIDGGAGDDTITLIGFAGDEVQFLIDGGAGDDEIIFEGAPVGGGGGSFNGFHRLTGGAGSDTIVGSLGTDLIVGGAGDDDLTGDHGDGSGDDDLIFGDGFELLATVARGVIAGNDGDDVIDGADGDDILFGQGGRDQIDGGDNNDIILGDGGEIAFQDDGKKVRDNVKDIWDGAVARTDNPDVANDDVLSGGSGDDWVFGGAGNDAIVDSGSENILVGGTGSDVIAAGSGFNIIFGDTGKIIADYTSFIPSNGDSEEEQLSDLAEIAELVAPGLESGRDQIIGGIDQDLIYGGGGNDTINGNAGVDMIFGGAGSDTIDGGAGRDSLLGEGQPDTLIGGAGDDRLDGGGGGDELLGGAGDDLLIATDGFDLLLGQGDDDTIKVFYQGGDTSSTIDIDGGGGSDVLAIFGTPKADEILLRADPGGSNAFIANMNGEFNVERVNYNDSVERIIVNGGLGDDFFAADDTAAEISIFGGLGEDTFQIGQLFRTARTVDAANIESPGDEIFTIETTRGFLSRGISQPMTISGGLGDDRFTVFHNAALLQLNGDQGDDEFEIRAFALVGSTDVQRERTDLSGGAGADLVRYAVSAPVNIDGGDGLDTVTVIGTEFSDDFVITEDGVFGAGLNVNFVNIEILRVDGAEGDDRFFLQSTDPGFVTELFGGLGSDTVFASGDTPPVVSNDLRGHSGIVAHEIESTDTDSVFHEQQVHGISANVADDEDAFAVLSISDGATIVTEGDAEGDSYEIVLTRRPEKDVLVTVGAPLPSETAREQRSYFFRVDSPDAVDSRDDGSTVTLRFTSANWNVAQTVEVLADDVDQSDTGRLFTRDDVEPTDDEAFSFDDDAFEGRHTGIVTHTYKSRDTAEGNAGDLDAFTNGDNPTVVIDAFGGFSADELIGHRFKITEGPGAVETRYITDAQLDSGQMTLTLDRAYDDKAPGAGASAYELIVDDSLSGVVGEFEEQVADEVFDDRTRFTVPGVGGDDSLIGRELAIIAGPGSGQAALILDVEGDDLILNRVFATDPVAGESVFRVTLYDGLASQVVEVRINDNDTPSLVVDESRSRAGGSNVDDIDTVTAVIEGGDGDHRGENDVVLFSLNKEPDSAVDVTVQFDEDQLTINGDDTGELTFTIDPGDWDEVQELVVSAVDDILREGFHNSLISFSISDGGDQTPSQTETIVVDPDVGSAAVGLSFEPVDVTSVELNGTDVNDIAALDYLVISNKVIFIEAGSGTDLSTAELAEIEGNVTVEYSYTEPGFDDAFAHPVLVRIADDDTPTLLVRETGGSTDVIEIDGYVDAGASVPDFWFDTYELVLTGAPADGETVKVYLDELITKTTKTGGVRHDEIQVDVFTLFEDRFGTEEVDDGEGGTFTREFLEFTSDDWDDPATVIVGAVNDDFLDGGDTKVFAPGPASLSGILGPVVVDGAGGEGSLVGIPEPLMLPGETNVKPATGDIAEIDNADSGAVITVNRSDLTGEVLHDLRIRVDPGDDPGEEPFASDDEIEALLGKTLEITRAPAAPSAVDQFRLIIDVDIDNNGTAGDLSDDTVTFTLNAPYELAEDDESFVDFSDVPRDDEDPSLAADGEPLVNRYALTSESLNFFVDEDEQVDVMFVNDQDSPADSSGTLTANRLFGLGMGPDLVVGDREFRGGITYGNFEVLELNLGTGYNDFDVLGTPIRDDGFQTWTILNTGTDIDDPNRTGERVGDTVNVFLNADDVTVDDGDTVSDATNPTSPDFQTRITLDGASFDDDALVGHQLELDQTVEGETSTIVRSIISNEGNTLVLGDPLPVDEAGAIDLDGLDGWRVVNRADGGFAVNTEGGDDLVDASASTLGIVAFGGAGKDEIIGGSGDDILFGDVGRVDYLSGEGAIVTRLGHAPEVITGKLADPPVGDGATTLEVIAFDPALPNEQGSIPLPAPDLSPGNDPSDPSETADTGLIGLFVDINDGTGFRQEPRLIVDNDEGSFTVDTEFTQGFDDTTRFRISTVPEDQTDGFAYDPGRILAVADAGGDDDVIHAGAGDDVVVGGEGNDEIATGEPNPEGVPDDDDIAFGDLGVVERTIDPAVPTPEEFGDPVPTRLASVRSIELSTGGDDEISGNTADDILIGGAGEDTIHGDDADGSAGGNDGDDIILGDNGFLEYQEGFLARVHSYPTDGAGDTLAGNAGDDLIIGGLGSDTIHGDELGDEREEDGTDVILGDNAELIFNDDFTGTDLLDLGLVTEDEDADFDTLDVIRTVDVDLGAGDTIVGGGADDLILGGKDGDWIEGGSGNDLTLGDFGRLELLENVVRYATVTDNTEDGRDTIFGDEDDDVLVGGADADSIDGGLGSDLVFGDNVEIMRRPGEITNPRFQALLGEVLYSRFDLDLSLQGIEGLDENDPLFMESGNDAGKALVDGIARDYRNAAGLFDALGIDPADIVPAWAEYEIVELYHDAETEDLGPAAGGYGNDYIAGGGGHDQIFGQLGDDVIQGDGAIASAIEGGDPVGAARVDAGGIELAPDFFAERRDLDLSPSFDAATDGDDYIEGNGGDDVVFGNLGQDDIIGGSSSLFTLVEPEQRPDGSDTLFGGSGTAIDRNDNALPGDGTAEDDRHARDADAIAGDNANIYRIVGTNGADGGGFLDFTYDNYNVDGQKIIVRAVELLDYTPGGPNFDPAAADDIGAADEIHGETGDDFAYGMVGDDVLFGDADDDDLIGGWGHDWISGGTGQDGVLGDDGRIYTSRNGQTEPLNGVFEATTQEDISTPGNMQTATIHVTGELKKAVDLTPFNIDPNTDMPDPLHDPEFADDIIFGGLGRDFLHGGAGDDAISGAEALQAFFDAPVNPGDALGFGDHTRAGEFRDYDEFDPLRKIEPFFLNFEATEADGGDAIFGALGNDWLVGGTDRDNLYGGYGNDLLDADDDKDTNGGANDAPDGPNASYEDRAYGGAGRDVLIANTGGDRLIDWAGEFNSYLVPFSPFGLATVSRALQPQIPEFLYDLSASDGADPTRAADTFENADRNGEPDGELGLVTQRDDDWQAQTGAPADPQAGNIPGGPRDVLRGADFNNGNASGFFADSGSWEVESGKLQVAADSLGGDAVSVYHVDEYLPTYFEIEANISIQKPKGGWDGNSYVVFDYQAEDDFKFAGVDDKRNKMQLGHRTAEGWIVDVETPYNVKSGDLYHLLISVNGTAVTAVLDNKKTLSHTFEARTDPDGFAYGINAGMVGFGSDNSRGVLDDVQVKVLPPEVTLDRTEDFEDADAELDLADASGEWTQADGRIEGIPDAGSDRAVTRVDLGIDGLDVDSLLTLTTIVNASAGGGFVFDRYAADDFKFAALDTASGELVIGHYGPKTGWTVDARVDEPLSAGSDYELELSLKGTTVSVAVKLPDAQKADAIVSHVFNAVTVDGGFGLLARDGAAAFDDLRVQTDDRAFDDDGDLLRAAVAGNNTGGVIGAADIPAVADEAIRRLADGFALDAAALDRLAALEFEVAGLPGLALGRLNGNTVSLDADAAGHGWFVDPTLADDAEFRRRVEGGRAATPASEAHGRIDLLTALGHELGHAIGFEHGHAGTFMNDSLEAGMRLVPPAGDTGTGKGRQEASTTRVFDEALGAFLQAEEARWLASIEAVSGSVHGLHEIDDYLDADEEDDRNGADDSALFALEEEGVPGVEAEPENRSSVKSGLTKGIPSQLVDWTTRFHDFRS